MGIVSLFALSLSAGCGNAAAPTGGSASPVPIELPSAITFPQSLSVDTSSLSGGGSANLAVGKTLSGNSSIGQLLHVANSDNTQIDAILDVLQAISVPVSLTTTSANGSTAGSGSWLVDFANFTFPTLEEPQLTSIDCSVACGGNAGYLPLCVRVYVNGKRAWLGKFTDLTATTSAGCFYTFSSVTNAPNETTLFDGTESYLLAGRWDFTGGANREIEYYSTTTAADTYGVTVTECHSYLTSIDSIVSANVNCLVDDNAVARTLEGVLRGDGTVTNGRYSIAGDDVTVTVEDCLDPGMATSATGCGDAVDISSDEVVERRGPPAVDGSVAVATLPSVTGKSPASGATGVPLNATISVTLSEEMDASTITSQTFFVAVRASIVTVPGSIAYSSRTATFTPSVSLSPEVEYVVTVTDGVKNNAGTPLMATTSWNFVTGHSADTTAPTVSSVTPLESATDVAVTSTVTARFSEALDSSTVNTTSVQLLNGSSTVSASVNYAADVITLTPGSSLDYSTTYTANLRTGLTDLAGNAFGGMSWTFTTADPVAGALDTDFSTDGRLTTDIAALADFGNDMVIQSDGNIVVVGKTTNANGDRDVLLVRYSTSGELDTTFGTNGIVTTDIAGGDEEALGVVLQSDGKIVVVGWGTGTSDRDFLVLRYRSNGTLDATFSDDGMVTTDFADITGGSDIARGVALDASGNIVVVGLAGTNGAIARYRSSGALDTNFSSDGMAMPAAMSDFYAVVVDDNGKIVLGGLRTISGDDDLQIYRLTSTGSADTSFNNGAGRILLDVNNGDDLIRKILLQTDGSLVVVGEIDVGNTSRMVVVRYDRDGISDTSFSSDGIVAISFDGYTAAGAHGAAIQSDGKIVVVGTVSNNSGATRTFAMARFSSDGSLDTSFGTGGRQTAQTANGNGEYFMAAAIESDGKIVAAGYANEGATSRDVVVMRFWP